MDFPGGPVVKSLPASAGKWNESHSLMSDSLKLHGLYSPWNSTGQNTGVSSLSLLQGIFPTQGSNPGLPNCRWILYQLSHKGRPPLQRRGVESLAQEDSTCHGATKPVSHNYWACDLKTLLCNKGSHHKEKSPWLQLEMWPHSNEDLAQPKVSKIIF